ncbi:MAG: hypothetical protein HC876_19090 [Chloroflexaceae bacterium]|nr:hypothetical protein [Chloroflexaceae bacterium]
MCGTCRGQAWRFEWEFEQPETRVRVWDGVRLVCSIIGVPPMARLFPLNVSYPFLNMQGIHPTTIPITYDVRATSTGWKLQVGPDGPLAFFKPFGPLATFVVKGWARLEAPRLLDPPPAEPQPEE